MTAIPKAARVIPRVWDLPQCGATRTNNYANDEPSTDRRCKRHAKIELDGRFLCLRHAEVCALQILLGEYRQVSPDQQVKP